MPTALEQLTHQALALSPEDRARLSDLLLASLPEQANEALEETWNQEIQRRVQALESGRSKFHQR